MELALPPEEFQERQRALGGTPLVAPPAHRRFVALEDSVLIVIDSGAVERLLRPRLRARGLVFAFASSHSALRREPMDRSPGELLFLQALVNNVGGIFANVSREKQRALCRTLKLREMARAQAACLQGHSGDQFFIVRKKMTSRARACKLTCTILMHLRAGSFRDSCSSCSGERFCRPGSKREAEL